MILKKFHIKQKDIFYYVGLSQIQLESRIFKTEDIIQIIENLQKELTDVFIQIFNDKYVLNTTHIFYAYYFMQKAFFNNTNISNKKNIEFLLYLATNRQISNALRDFGINKEHIKTGRINICMISSRNDLNVLNLKIQKVLNSIEKKYFLDEYSIKKYKDIKKYFQISKYQIISVLRSYGFESPKKEVTLNDLPNLYLAINDLLCEKMALLSLEKA